MHRQVRLGDDPLCVRQGVIACRDGVLVGGFENGVRLRAQSLGLSSALGYCGSYSQGDAGNDVLQLPTAGGQVDGTSLVVRVTQPVGLGFGGRQQRCDGVLSPVHVVCGITKYAMSLGSCCIAVRCDLGRGRRPEHGSL